MIIHAMAKLVREFPNTYLLMVGDGPRKDELVSLAKSLKVSRHIVFTGPVPNAALPDYYRAADIAFNSFTRVPAADRVIHTPSLCNSIKQVHPISISFSTIESLASGVPVVAVVKNVRNYRQREMSPTDCGVLTPEDDLLWLTNMIKGLIKNPSKVEEMGKHARECAVKKRNLENSTRKVVDVYNHVLGS